MMRDRMLIQGWYVYVYRSERDIAHRVDNILLGRCHEVRLDRVAVRPADTLPWFVVVGGVLPNVLDERSICRTRGAVTATHTLSSLSASTVGRESRC